MNPGTTSGSDYSTGGNGTVQSSAPNPPADPSLSCPANVADTYGTTIAIPNIVFTNSFSASNAGQASLDVSCSYGTLSAKDASNNAVSGSGTNHIRFAPHYADLKAALASLSYTAPNSGSTDAVTITIYDQQGRNFTVVATMQLSAISPGMYSGSDYSTGGNGTVQSSAPNPPADPSLSCPANVTDTYGTTITLPNIVFTDSFSASNPGQASLDVSCNYGTLSAKDASGNAVSGSGSSHIRFAPRYADLRAALASLGYTAPGSGPNDAVTITIYDQQGRNFTVVANMQLYGTFKAGVVSGSDYSTGGKNEVGGDGVVQASAPNPPADPSLSCPANLTDTYGTALAVPNIKFTDSASAANGGQAALDITCNYGTVSAKDTGGNALPGSGTSHITFAPHYADLQATLGSLSYTAPGSGTNDVVATTIVDQFDTRFAVNISVILASASSYVPAHRIADMMEIFGANCYPNGQGGADPSASGHAAGFAYLCGGSGMGMLNRLYARTDSTSSYPAFAQAVSSDTRLPPNSIKWSICATYAGSDYVIATGDAMRANGILAVVEGFNEPNNSGANGGSDVTPDVCLQIQQQLYSHFNPLGIAVAAPSVSSNGYPNFEQTYYNETANGVAYNTLSGEVANSTLYNTHFYPPKGSPSNGFYMLTDNVSRNYWNGKPGLITEFHPTLYNTTKDEATGAYFSAIALLSGFVDYRLRGLIWWSMFDYTGYANSGLFHGINATNPSDAAKVIRAMYQLTTDLGAGKRSFQPGGLYLTVSGLPLAQNGTGGGRYALFQNSAGTYFLFVWNEQSQLQLGTTRTVTVSFGGAPRSQVTDYSLTNPFSDNPQPKQTLSNVSTMTLNLTTEVRLLVIK